MRKRAEGSLALEGAEQRLLHYWLSRVRLPAAKRRALKGKPGEILQEFRRDDGGISMEQLELGLAEAKQRHIQVLLPGDALYERVFSRLHELGINVPYILYMQGDARLLLKRGVAFVGSRRTGGYGLRVTRELVQSLAHKDVTIVSGGARGIDTMAHESALQAGLGTICVLGCGIGWDYPPENRELFRAIARQGLLLSEYQPGERPQKYYFPERNRIIAQLAEHVVVTAAGRDSGALHTAEFALECDHRVYAIPYGIYDKEGEGCNFLLETGAEMVSNCEQFPEILC